MTLALVLSLFVGTTEDVDVYAVVIGHNGGSPASVGREALPALRFADDDALRLAYWFGGLGAHVELLARPDERTRSTWANANIEIPPNRPPTRVGLFSILEGLNRKLAGRVGRKSKVIIFYAGHGVSGRLLLEPEHGTEASVTGHELQLRLAQLPADQVFLFVDACRAQSLFVERGGPDFSREIEQLENSRTTSRLGVLVAAQADKPAGEAADLMGGFFSHVLASGMAGGADADGDQIVNFGELTAFVAFHTQRLTGQNPWFRPPGGSLASPVVDLRNASRIELQTQTEGRMSVRTPAGMPIFVEVNKAKGQAMRLALPVGSYSVLKRIDASRAMATTVVLEPKAQVPVDDFQREQAVVPLGERGDVEWDSVSFQTPFSQEAVAALSTGYVSQSARVQRTAVDQIVIDLAYQLAPSPFGWSGVAHGAEFDLRWHRLGLEIGAMVGLDFSSAQKADGARAWAQRGVLAGRAGWRFEIAKSLVVTPGVLLGISPHFVQTSLGSSVDFWAPLGAGALHVDWRLSTSWSVFLDAKVGVRFVQFDGVRIPLLDPAVSAGVSLWL